MIYLTTGQVRFYNDRWSWQGWIREFLIRGIQTLVQKGLLNFIVANCSSPTPPPTSCSCMHVIIPWPLTVYLNHWMKKWISLQICSCAKECKLREKYAHKVVNAKFAHPFAPLCKWFSTFGIYHLYAFWFYP